MLGIVALSLAMPIVPFVLWGEPIEIAVQQWHATGPNQPSIAGAVFGLLVLDIFLPVPSSMISTWAGSQLGWFLGTLICFLGLNVGACFGFAVAKSAGSAFRARWIQDRDVVSMKQFFQKWGVLTLVVTRPLPVLAEAAVVLLGLQGLSWKKFIPSVSLTNFGIAFAYCVLGEIAAKQEWLVAALAFSAAAPLLLMALLRKNLRNPENATYSRGSERG